MENRFLTSYKAKGTAYEFGHNQRELVFAAAGQSQPRGANLCPRTSRYDH